MVIVAHDKAAVLAQGADNVGSLMGEVLQEIIDTYGAGQYYSPLERESAATQGMYFSYKTDFHCLWLRSQHCILRLMKFGDEYCFGNCALLNPSPLTDTSCRKSS